MDAPALVQQFTHLVYPDHFDRLSNLLRQFADKAGKIHDNRKQTKHKRKNNEQTDSMFQRQEHLSFHKSNGAT